MPPTFFKRAGGEGSAASAEQGMDAYDLIGEYMEQAKSGGILMTITEAKDAIAQDYAKELLSSPKALNNITKTAPEVAKTFKIMADRYEASAARTLNRQSTAKNLFEPLHPARNTQNSTKTALKDGEGNGIIGERTGVGTEGAGKTVVDTPFDDVGNLIPNVNYKSGEFSYNYETDSLGRVENFSTGKLQMTTRTKRIPHYLNTPGKLPNDHAGHIAGDRFGGSGDLDNLISQSSQTNLSTYKKLKTNGQKQLGKEKLLKWM